MKTHNSIVVAFFVTALTVQSAFAQILPAAKQQDALFPGEGKTELTVWTGIPYIGIAEFAYGISDRFSVSLIGGFTPSSTAIGIRLRGIVAQSSDDFRFYLKGPILYYPGTNDSHGEPWFFAWPTLNAEWRLESGVRIWCGAGLAAASCAHHLFGIEDAAMEMGGEGFTGGLWNTFSAGISKPVSDKIELHGEAAVVMRGLKFADDPTLPGKRTDIYWGTRLPMIIDLGMSYAF